MSNYLVHSGTKGMVWGVRRYQNYDGTLTEEGKLRYGKRLDGSLNPSNKGVLRRLATGDHALALPLVSKRSADKREYRLAKKIEKMKSEQKDTTKLEAKYNAQKQKNIDRDVYLANTSTGKLVAQNLLLPSAYAYRNARASGISRGQAAVENALGLVANVIPYVIDSARDYEKYGTITYSAFDEEYLTI